MNAAGSDRPRSESAASCRAATQPFGARLQRGDVAGGELERSDLVEVGRDLGQGEAQVGGADLDEVAPGAQARQRQRRVDAGADDQVHLGREVLEQVGHARLQVGVVDEVVVVQDEVQLGRRGGSAR